MAGKAPKMSYEERRAEEDRRVREALVKAGVSLGPDQSGARLRIGITARVTKDMGLEFGRLSIAFKNEMIRFLKNISIDSPIMELYIFPMMLNPKIATMPDYVRCKQKFRVASVGLNLSYLEWVNLSHAEKVDLLAKNICDSIGKIGEQCLSHPDREKLLTIVRKVQKILQDPKKAEQSWQLCVAPNS
jgi:hypothetical protein